MSGDAPDYLQYSVSDMHVTILSCQLNSPRRIWPLKTEESESRWTLTCPSAHRTPDSHAEPLR
jgi:hypothetical protein